MDRAKFIFLSDFQFVLVLEAVMKICFPLGLVVKYCLPMQKTPGGGHGNSLQYFCLESGLPFPSPGDHPHPGIGPRSPKL